MSRKFFLGFLIVGMLVLILAQENTGAMPEEIAHQKEDVTCTAKPSLPATNDPFPSKARQDSIDKMVERTERTFLCVKPDGVQRGLVGKIIQRFEERGYKLVAIKFVQAKQELLEEHYAEHKGKGFFPKIIGYMSSGPVVPMVWEGTNVVATARKMLGATKPQESAPGTIRGDFGIDVGRNIIHGSDGVEAANREIGLWFRPEELVAWKPAEFEWVYE